MLEAGDGGGGGERERERERERDFTLTCFTALHIKRSYGIETFFTFILCISKMINR